MSEFSIDHAELPGHAAIHEDVGGDCTRVANDVPGIDAGIASTLVAALVDSLVRELGSVGLVNGLLGEQLRELAEDVRATDEEAADAFHLAGSTLPGLDP